MAKISKTLGAGLLLSAVAWSATSSAQWPPIKTTGSQTCDRSTGRWTANVVYLTSMSDYESAVTAAQSNYNSVADTCNRWYIPPWPAAMGVSEGAFRMAADAHDKAIAEQAQCRRWDLNTVAQTRLSVAKNNLARAQREGVPAAPPPSAPILTPAQQALATAQAQLESANAKRAVAQENESWCTSKFSGGNTRAQQACAEMTPPSTALALADIARATQAVQAAQTVVNGERCDAAPAAPVAPQPAAPAGTFYKAGNNGTVSCQTYCAGNQWSGGVGTCQSATRTDNQQSVACNVVPGLLPNAKQLTCLCASSTVLAPSALVFSSGDSRKDPSSTSDWMPGSYKAECPASQDATGLSAATSGASAHALLCGAGANTKGASGKASCRNVSFASADNRSGATTGDWDPNYVKGECAPSEYVAGVSQKPGGGSPSILCCANPSVPHPRTACKAMVMGQSDARESTSSGDWDSGYYKGECGAGRFMVGMSRAVSGGRPHAILCCGP